MLTVIYFLITLGIIVLIHELGHFTFARLAGVKVETFSICFGKPLLKWKDKKGTQWQIGWIPLGGYVKMLGQEDMPTDKKLKELDKDVKKQHFLFKSWWQRFSIIIGGVLFNFVSALIIIFCLFQFVGVPKTPALVSDVVDGMPAQQVGIMKGDVISKFNNVEIKDFKSLQKELMLNQEKEVNLIVLRSGKEIVKSVIPVKSGKSFVIGIKTGVSSEDIKKLPFGQTVVETFKDFWSQATTMITGIKQLLLGERSSKELGGFIQIAKVSKESADGGIYNFLYFLAFISINLGLLNLFPIPVLDGGHIVFLIIEAIRGKPVSEKFYNFFAYIGLGILLFLLVLSNFNDILRLLGK